ncbi:MAG: glycosyltransferase family 2 protein [Patescibacteria group bacterium]|nr:glycosyltransferase family 2 protein [Patescibacteria group bacterium]
MARADFSIIIVNWKVRDLLDRCLASILADAGDLTLEIIVVDNNSQDGSLKMLAQKYPQIKVLALEKNFGFAKANNLALAKASGSYIVLLNPDTEIVPGFFGQSKAYLESNPEVVIFGPKLLNPDASIQASVRSLPDWRSQILILLKLKNIPLAKKFFQAYLLPDFDYDREQPVDQIMGAAIVARAEVLKSLNFFDERFFIWFEEVDLCYRAKKNGWLLKYFPGASVVHYGGQSFGQANTLKKQMIFNKSLLYYFYKHQPRWQYLLIALFLPLNFILTLFYVIFLQSKRTANNI